MNYKYHLMMPFAKHRKKRNVKKILNKYKDLKKTIEKAIGLSDSTGADICDYAVLYHYIRTRKPKYILECGTGKSTYVMAKAIIDNFHSEIPKEIKIVSMESEEKWYKEAKSRFPEEWNSFVDIRLEKKIEYAFGVIRGTAYEKVPNYPYEFVFVDGPSQKIDGARTANMDFIRLIEKTELPVTAIIDCRTTTVGAYALLLSNHKIKYHVSWDLGVVNNVSQEDLIYRKKKKIIKAMSNPLINYTVKPPISI